MLDFDPNRPPIPPRIAATTLVLRQGLRTLEILGILRHPQSTFLGGVLAFPGGKVDPEDRAEHWVHAGEPAHSTRLHTPELPRTLAVAACRELLEEVAIFPANGLHHAEAVTLQEQLREGAPFPKVIAPRVHSLELWKLHTFGRWITPEAEEKRYDATFFLMELPEGQEGRSDQHETTAILWDSAAGLLERWERGELRMAPPTTRMLEILSDCTTVADALKLTEHQCLEPVCPRFIANEQGGYLALPGDPSHEIQERRVAGSTRFVPRGNRLVSEDP